jgi:hypothetical protein
MAVWPGRWVVSRRNGRDSAGSRILVIEADPTTAVRERGLLLPLASSADEIRERSA